MSATRSVDVLRDEALRDLDALREAVVDARTNLRSYQSALEKNYRHLRGGGRVSDMQALFDVCAMRTSLTSRLDRVERARSMSRLSLWRVQLTEGTTIAEIGRVWGLSRQLVSRALAGATNSPCTADTSLRRARDQTTHH